MVDALITLAISKLERFISANMVVPRQATYDAAWMIRELCYMYGFLKDDNQKQEIGNRWITDITNTAKQIVVVLDKYTVNTGDGNWLGRFCFYTHLCSKEPNVFDIAGHMAALKARVEDLGRRTVTYQVHDINAKGGRALRRTNSCMGWDQKLIGRTVVKKKLIDELFNEESRRCVVAIHGIGGSGKTTLARSIYKSEEVISRFHKSGWTCVSQDCNIADVLRSLINSLENICRYDADLEKMDVTGLEKYLREKLKDVKYLLVVDDVWDRNTWAMLKRSFPDGVNGSRVIVTTRSQKMARQLDDRVHIKELRLLGWNESVELFFKKLNPEKEKVWPAWCNNDMKTLGTEMVEKCEGLSIALVVLGRLLARNRRVDQWYNVRKGIWSHLKDDSVEICHVFSLSYDVLPHELKICFLYMGTFPEDDCMDSQELSYSWMAEGFIGGQDIAASHLKKLLNHNLINEDEVFLGGRNLYKIHDLLRNLARKKASQVRLFDIYNPIHGSIQNCHTQRHVVSTPNIQSYVTSAQCNKGLQTLTMFNKPEGKDSLASPQLIARIGEFTDLKILKLRNFETSPKLFNAIGNLVRLTYLMLLTTNQKVHLPPSLGKLKRLQTLEVRGGCCYLPYEIRYLKELMHLDCRSIRGDVAGITYLSGLQILRVINYNHWVAIKTRNLVNVRHLEIDNIRGQLGFPLQSIVMLMSLHILKLDCPDEDYGFPTLDFLSSLDNLRALVLFGKIKELLPAEKWPRLLTSLSLSNSDLEENPIPIIEKLSNLKRLELRRTHDSATVSFSSGCLPQLKYLFLGDFPNLKKVEVEEDALPIIKRLRTGQGVEFNDMVIPDRLKSVMTQFF